MDDPADVVDAIATGLRKLRLDPAARVAVLKQIGNALDGDEAEPAEDLEAKLAAGARPMGAMDAAALKSYRERYPNADRLVHGGSAHVGSSRIPGPLVPKMTAEQERAYAERYPNAGRLKTA